jgi:hypothetical protein
MFYDLAKTDLYKFDQMPYSDKEFFIKYLKEVAKGTCGQVFRGIEGEPKKLKFF